MHFQPCYSSPEEVALLAEGVDRNCPVSVGNVRLAVSPSSRRAWIEISMAVKAPPIVVVALLAEGVDRNCTSHAIIRMT